MQVRNNIAEAGEVDLVGFDLVAHDALDRMDHIE